MSAGIASRARIKICGITNREDAEIAIELGADALGFNTWPGSKRFIDLVRGAEWIGELPPFVTRVAVMVNPSIAEAEAVFKLPFVDAVQFHGEEGEAFCAHFAKLGLPFFKAIALKDALSAEDIEHCHTRRILLDAYSPHGFGGMGKLIDLDLAEKFARAHRDLCIILSGGLTPMNVADAIRKVHPYAVDVASGVESEQRRKDRELVAKFIRAVRSA